MTLEELKTLADDLNAAHEMVNEIAGTVVFECNVMVTSAEEMNKHLRKMEETTYINDETGQKSYGGLPGPRPGYTKVEVAEEDQQIETEDTVSFTTHVCGRDTFWYLIDGKLECDGGGGGVGYEILHAIKNSGIVGGRWGHNHENSITENDSITNEKTK